MGENSYTVTIDGQEVIISEIDKDRVLQSNVTLKELDKFIFGIKGGVRGTGLVLKHKNGNTNDYRRSNLILTDVYMKDNYLVREEFKDVIGIHLDPYTTKVEYETIFTENGKLVVYNDTLFKESKNRLDKWKSKNRP